MASTWIPAWLGATWATVFIAILAVHLRHVVTMTGRPRLWHGTHVVMALGMIDMFWPGQRMLVSGRRSGELLFGAVALGILIMVAADRLRRGNGTLLWHIAVLDLAAMVYMFAMPSTRYLWLSVALAVWFGLEAIGWARGRLAMSAQQGGLIIGLRHVVGIREFAAATGPGSTPLAGLVQLTEIQDALQGKALRASLALMSVGMAYMFVAMQFGMAAMMPGLHSKPGM